MSPHKKNSSLVNAKQDPHAKDPSDYWDTDPARATRLMSLYTTTAYSFAQLAEILTKEFGAVSRNAVLGKVRRLIAAEQRQSLSSGQKRGRGNNQNPKPSKQKLLRAKAVKAAGAPAQAKKAPKEEQEAPITAITLADGTHATTLTINDRMCHWPIGEVGQPSFHYCGRAPKLGSPYCEGHARKMHEPSKVPHYARKSGKISSGLCK